MRRTWLLTALLTAALPALAAKPPNVQWTKAFVGWGSACGFCVQQTFDGGYVAVGNTDSRDSSYESTIGQAVLLVKLSASGDGQWVRTFKAIGGMVGFSVAQTSDGGYVVAGSAIDSFHGKWNACLIKTDASGNELWRSSLADEFSAYAQSVVELGDTGYAGVARRAFADSAVILWRIDNKGNLKWGHAYKIYYHYNIIDDLVALRRTSDGGYIIATKTLLEVDSLGAQPQLKTFSSVWNANSVIQTSDGGYAATGTMSDYSSIYLIKTDANLRRSWMRTYLPSNWSRGNWVEQTTDGGYIVAGTSRDSSLDDKVTLVSTRPDGVPSWTDTLFSGEGACVRQTTDGGYVVCGTCWTGPSLFVTKLAPDRRR